MIESKFSRPTLDSLGYSFKDEEKSRKKVEKKKREESNPKEKKEEKKPEKSKGTNFNEYGIKLFTRIQLLFFCISFFLIPIALFPLEWMMFEYGRVFVLIILTIILLTFEILKFLIQGKLEVYKSPKDTIILLLGFSFLLSLLFSSDSLVSFWGYEFRLGTGFLSISAILIYILVLKSTVKESKDIVSLIFSFSLGILASAFLSIISFYGLNPYGIIPEFQKFFLTGLPFFNSAKLSIVVWSVGLLLSFFVFYNYFLLFSNDQSYLNKKLSLSKAYSRKRAIQISLLGCFAFFAFVFVLAISLFSIKNLAWFGLISLVGVILIFGFLTLLGKNRILKISSIVVALICLAVFGLTQIPFVQNQLSIDQENLVEQVTLENEAIWEITVSSLSDSFFQSVVGLGNDNFVVAYNLYRPAFSGDIDLNLVNYSYANNEIYNILANRGFAGLFIWLIAGFFLAKQFYKYLTDEGRKNLLPTTSTENIGIVLFDLIILYIWIFSFFSYYSFILYFTIFVMIAISSLLKNVSYKMHSEILVVQTNFFVEKIGLVKNNSVPQLLTFLVCLGSIIVIYHTINDFSSKIYAVRAESTMKELSGDAQERDEIYNEARSYYTRAIERSPENYTFRRKVSLIFMNYINDVLSEEFANIEEEDQRQDFVRIVSVYAQGATEEIGEATRLAPSLAINWAAKDLIYSDLVKMGFHNYLITALEVSENVILREPNNYNAYLNSATYHYLLGDGDNAISTIRKSLEINSYHVPSLIMAGEISMGLQDYPNAKVYFQKAEILLQELDISRDGINQLYQQVRHNLDYLEGLESGNFEISQEELEINLDEEGVNIENVEEALDIDIPEENIEEENEKETNTEEKNTEEAVSIE